MEGTFTAGMASVTALVVAALLLLLYAYRRRTYILEWTVGWLLLAVAPFVLSRESAHRQIENVGYGVSLFFVIASGLMFTLGLDSYRQRPRLSRAYGLGLLALLIWFTLAPLALEEWSVQVPGPLVAAGVLAAAGVGYAALAVRIRLLGAGLIGLAFTLIAVTNVWLSLSFAGVSVVPRFQLVSGVALLYILAGFGMHLMVLEDMTSELGRTNTRLEAAQSELRQLVITDALTGCYNRRFFDEVINREMQRHHRYRLPMSVLFVDVDRFKAVNDSLGHEAGDRLLQLVASLLTRYIREVDYVFRWGGDEFVILLTCVEEEAQRKGLDLQALFARTPEVAALPAGVALSFGCAEFPDDVDDAMRIVRMADERMYRNKARDRRLPVGLT
jgi:diguanylate cyclase (GGDEF)-like protein